MKRVLITGATGFIGSHLARALLPRAEVYGLARMPLNTIYISDIQNQITWLPCDGTYKTMETALKISQPDLVYHLAAYYTPAHGAEETSMLIHSNIIFGAYLLEAMAANNCQRLVYASTIVEHCQGKEYCPLNLYAATKHAFTDLLSYYTEADMIHATRFVISDTYGSDDHRPKVLNLVKRAAETGELLELSDGGQDYDLVHIDDVVQALLMADASLGTFQICAAKPYTLRETVEKFLNINQLTLHAAWGARPSSERGIRRAVRLYPTVPGWTQTVTLEDGLRRFWLD